MALLLDSLFFSVAFSHLIVDILNGQRSVLFAYLSVPLGLSNTALGLVTTAYVVSAALMQPIFGYITDRVGPRWVVAGGVLWMGGLFAVGLLLPGKAALLFLVLASLGSGAFHPAGTMQATLRGRTHYAGRETTATSFFFLFGQFGLFVGPLLGGFILDRSGPPGLLVFPALALPVGLNAAWRLRNRAPQPVAAGGGGGDRLAIAKRYGLLMLIALMLLITFQSWSQQNMITFLPKYLSDLGISPGLYGLVASLFMGGSAFGNVAGGNLADRYGKRRVAMIALGIASLPFFLVRVVGWSPWLFLLVPLAGGLTGATHSIIVVIAQRLIPTGMGLSSGLVLGYMFASGALGTLASGQLADLWGVEVVFTLSALLILAAAVVTRALPQT